MGGGEGVEPKRARHLLLLRMRSLYGRRLGLRPCLVACGKDAQRWERSERGRSKNLPPNYTHREIRHLSRYMFRFDNKTQKYERYLIDINLIYTPH